MTFPQLVAQAAIELEDRALQDVVDLLRALLRDNEAKSARIKALEVENETLKYGGF